MSYPVFFFLIDGLRPDALEAADAPNLKAFRQRCSYTMQAKSLMPTITLPCHMSMFYSVTAARHGLMSNTFSPMARPLPSVVDQAALYRKKNAFFTSWDGFSALHQPGRLDFQYIRNYMYEDGSFRLPVDDELTDAAVQFIPKAEPDFTFIYYGTTDSAGHAYGWMEKGYMDQITRVDQQFGRVLPHLPENAIVLVQADHGGHEKTHGTDMPEDVLIPWMIAGPPIKQNYEIQQEVTLLNTAPTIAHFLDIPADGNWEGEMVQEILV